jgi:hypothetical protein
LRHGCIGDGLPNVDLDDFRFFRERERLRLIRE